MADSNTAAGARRGRVVREVADRAVPSLLSRPSLGSGLAAIITFAIFSFIAPHFDSSLALATVLQLSAELGIVAVGVTLLMIAGEYDLSIGSVAALSALLVAEMSQAHIALIWAVLAVVAMAAGIGLLNGIIVTVAGAPSLIVTLGGLFFWESLVLLITKGYPVTLEGYGSLTRGFSSTWHNYPVAVAWWVGASLIFGFILWRTPLGNRTFATGGDPAAARNMGVSVRGVKILLFMITAVLAAMVGMISLTRFGAADATIGQNMELTAIAATVIGGTQLQGGGGTIAGTIFGVLTLGMIEVGLQLAAAPSYLYQGLVGLLLLAAVLVNLYIVRLARLRG